MAEGSNNPETVRSIILSGAERFTEAGLVFAQGMPEAIDEAVYLCLSALGRPLDMDEAAFDDVLCDEDIHKVNAYYDQRIAERRPASYITRRAMFAGREYYVDERVLIPRSPFAELIENGFRPWVDPGRVTRILDMCTGSGCIAIACAHQFPAAEVTASDISEEALEVARINRSEHGLEDRLTLIRSDLFRDIGQQTFDVIACNPPYVSEAEMQQLPAEFDHEPSLGLTAGEEGLDLVVPILARARDYLTDDGVLFLELGYTWPDLQQRFPQVPFMWLDFEYGGEGVLTMTARELEAYRSQFEQAEL